MVNRPRTPRIKYGDTVTTRFGSMDIVGVVQEVYGPPGSRHVTVRVPWRGLSGEILEEENMTFSLKEVRLVESA
jgi:hypothetical protein